MMQPIPTIVFCLPGNIFSGPFLECWTNLIAWCLASGIRPVVSREYSNNIYYSRNLCLGGDVMRGPEQKPFNGQIDYSHIMWIDSDILFSPEQFAEATLVPGNHAAAPSLHSRTGPECSRAQIRLGYSFSY